MEMVEQTGEILTERKKKEYHLIFSIIIRFDTLIFKVKQKDNNRYYISVSALNARCLEAKLHLSRLVLILKLKSRERESHYDLKRCYDIIIYYKQVKSMIRM